MHKEKAVVVTSDELTRIMEDSMAKSRNNYYVNMQEIVRELNVRGIDVGESFLRFCEDATAYHYFGFRTLRYLNELASSGELSETQAERLLAIAEKEPYGIYNDAECLGCIYHLGHRRIYKDVLLKFAERQFKEKKCREWRWNAFIALGQLLKPGTVLQLSKEFLQEIAREAEKEHDERRRNQLIFLAGRLWENQKLY